jgi:hypothetical protein
MGMPPQLFSSPLTNAWTHWPALRFFRLRESRVTRAVSIKTRDEFSLPIQQDFCCTKGFLPFVVTTENRHSVQAAWYLCALVLKIALAKQ